MLEQWQRKHLVTIILMPAFAKLLTLESTRVLSSLGFDMAVQRAGPPFLAGDWVHKVSHDAHGANHATVANALA